MSRLWIDIERIVLDGVALDPAKAGRLATLTQMALERLLRERPTAKGSPPAAEERWADELAQTIFRAVDRSV